MMNLNVTFYLFPFLIIYITKIMTQFDKIFCWYKFCHDSLGSLNKVLFNLALERALCSDVLMQLLQIKIQNGSTVIY
jgi:hypothetical protein